MGTPGFIWSTLVIIVVCSEVFFGYSLMGILGFSFGFLKVSFCNIGHLVNFGQHCGGGDV